MFFTTTLKENDLDYLLNYIYPEMDIDAGKIPVNYRILEPYRLIFTTSKQDEGDNYINNCFISPKGSLYAALSVEEFSEINDMKQLHKHDFFEFMFVIDGEVYVNIENSRHLYKKGSCCILNRNVRHSEEYSTSFQIVFLQLSASLARDIYADLCLDYFDIEKLKPASDMKIFLETNLDNNNFAEKDYVDFIPATDHEYLIEKVHGLFDNITRNTMAPNIGTSIEIKNQLTQLINFMSAPNNFSTTPIQIGSDAESALFNNITGAMIESDGRISRSQLSEMLHYSGAYLNAICKKYSGLSLFDYGMTYCMKKAAELLSTTNENIGSIEASLGFTNHTHFYKMFKSTYDMTPAEYRRTYPHR